MMSLYIIVLVSLLAAFIVLVVKKWGVAEWMQVHGNKFVSQLFSCDLCMSFWACLLCAVVLAFATDTTHLLLLPLFSTPITRMIV